MKKPIPIAAYIEMTKPRIVLMVGVMAALGYYLGVREIGQFPGWGHFLIALLGTGLAGGGASVLNMYLERDVDCRMERTRDRPLPTGKITPQGALYYGVILTLGGCFLLLFEINMLAAFLALQSTYLYVLVYTPMKRLTWWNTSVGAVPGAIPPLIGWAAATGSLGVGAWILFAVLYIWQHPHFYAIAWMYREDYARGGLKMLPVVHPDGRSMFRQVIWFSVLMIPVSLLPTLFDSAGAVYFAGTLAIGLAMLYYAAIFARRRTTESARTVLRASLVYLPMLLVFLLIDALI